MTASMSQMLKLHEGDLSVRLLRQNVVSRFNTVLVPCDERPSLSPGQKSDKFTVFSKCVYQWRNLTRRSGLAESWTMRHGAYTDWCLSRGVQKSLDTCDKT